MTVIVKDEFNNGCVVELSMDDEAFYVFFHNPKAKPVIRKYGRNSYELLHAMAGYEAFVTEAQLMLCEEE